MAKATFPVAAVFAFVSAMLLTSCIDSFRPRKIKLHDPKALFTSDTRLGGKSMSLPRSSKGGWTDGFGTLHEMLADGSVQEVPFLNKSGLEVNVRVGDVRKLSCDRYLGIGFEYGSSPFSVDYCRVIADTATGKLWDFDDFHYNYGVFYGGQLYLRDDASAIYRFNVETFTGTPMNNPEFDPVEDNSVGSFGLSGYPFLVTQGGWVHVWLHGERKMLDPAGGFPADSWIDNVRTMGVGGTSYSSNMMWSTDGTFYKVGVETAGSSPPYTHTVTYGTIDESYHPGPVLHQVENDYETTQYYMHFGSNGGYDGWSLYDTDRYLIVRDGYVRVTPGAEGGIDFEWLGKDMSFLDDGLFDSSLDSCFRNGVIYWRDGNTIKKFDIVNDVAVIDLVTDDSMIDWWRVADTVFYTAYITFLDVGTYRVDTPGTSTLVKTSEMEMVQIVEFQFE